MHGFSLIKLFTAFAMLGAEWVMWVLIGLSVASITIMVERARYYRRLNDDLVKLGASLKAALSTNNHGAARELLQASPSPAALVALAGLDEAGNGAHAAEHVMQSVVARVKQQLDKNLSVLSTIGNNAPFVGLFGTVIGIIQAFDALKPPEGVRGAAAAAMAAAASAKVMGTIAEALVATAIGLLVAIPAVAANNFFQRKVKSLLGSTETLSQLVLGHIHGTHGDGLRDLVSLLRQDKPRINGTHANGTNVMSLTSVAIDAGRMS